MEAHLVATSTKDASGAPPSIHPAEDTGTYTNDGSDCAVFAYDIEDTTGRVALAMGALNAPSSTYSPVDATIDCASPNDTVAAPMPLMLTTGAALVGS